jgi:hypothetical protein
MCQAKPAAMINLVRKLGETLRRRHFLLKQIGLRGLPRQRMLDGCEPALFGLAALGSNIHLAGRILAYYYYRQAGADISRQKSLCRMLYYPDNIITNLLARKNC